MGEKVRFDGPWFAALTTANPEGFTTIYRDTYFRILCNGEVHIKTMGGEVDDTKWRQYVLYETPKACNCNG